MRSTQLTIYHATDPNTVLFTSFDLSIINSKLKTWNLVLQQWPLIAEPSNDVLEDYAEPIKRLQESGQYQTVDVMSVFSQHPNKEALRKKFLFEHTHSEDEVRFFVHGYGLFCLHVDDFVLQLLCCAGDLICVPKGIKHWFDMGSEPDFTVIRFFNNEQGWEAQASENDLASHFALLD